MRFYLDNELTHSLFERKFGGIENFVDEWASRNAANDSQSGLSRSVKTVYSWLAQGMPKRDEVFFSFFGALNVDPIAIADLERSKFQKNFGRLRQAILLGGMNIGGFRPLLYFLKPGPQWPEGLLMKKYYGRDWTRHDFAHEAVDLKNSNVTLRVAGNADVPTDWPRAYHIAYRGKSNADGLWRPYGTIIWRAREARLVQENGAMREVDLPIRSQHKVDFKTFFGPSPAEFRLVSLHPFSLKLDLFDDPDVKLVFEG